MPDESVTPMEDPAGEAERPGRFGLLSRVAVDLSPLRESPAFRRLWIGQAISSLGTMVTGVAVPYQVYQLTGSTLAVGLLGIAALVPLLTVPLVGGAIADAIDRRRLLFATEIGLAGLSGLLLANALLAHPLVWVLFVLEAVGTALYGLQRPAMDAMMPRLVGEDRIAAASAVQGVYQSFAHTGGPAVGGVLIATIGLPGSYAVDVATFAASLAAAWLLPPLPPAHDADRVSLRSVVEGLRFARSKPELIGIFVVDTNAMIFGMPSALFPAFGEHFGGGAQTVGFLYAAPYAGALVASLVSGWTSHVRRLGLGVCVAAGLWGAAIVGFGLAGRLWLALVMLAVAGAADFVSAVLRSVILMTTTPDALRGRLSGIELAQVAGAPTLGNVEAGVVASLTSLRFSVVSGGLACVAGTVLCALALPAFVRYRREALADAGP